MIKQHPHVSEFQRILQRRKSLGKGGEGEDACRRVGVGVAVCRGVIHGSGAQSSL